MNKEIGAIPLPHTIKYKMKFVTCDVCSLLKNIDEGFDRCRKCNILQCNDCSTIEMVGTKITISCSKCGAFIGSGTPDFMTDEDREKLR